MNNKKKNIIPLSEYKEALKMFQRWDIDVYAYYKKILLNNDQQWHFVNPMNCKQSFITVYNMLKFCIFKRLLKEGYKLKAYRKDRFTFSYSLEKKIIRKRRKRMKTQNLYYLKQLFNDVKTDYKYLKIISEPIADKVETKISQNKYHWHSICSALHFSYVLMFDNNYLILKIINNNTNKIKTLLYFKDDWNLL